MARAFTVVVVALAITASLAMNFGREDLRMSEEELMNEFAIDDELMNEFVIDDELGGERYEDPVIYNELMDEPPYELPYEGKVIDEEQVHLRNTEDETLKCYECSPLKFGEYASRPPSEWPSCYTSDTNYGVLKECGTACVNATATDPQLGKLNMRWCATLMKLNELDSNEKCEDQKQNGVMSRVCYCTTDKCNGLATGD